MTEYTETEVLTAIKTMGLFRTSYPKDVVEKAVNNALKIADRVEKVDAEDNEIIYDKCCKCCIEHDDCIYLRRRIMCETVSDFFEGYQKALADIRGDNNGTKNT